MPDHLGDDMRKVKSDEEKEEKDIKPLDGRDMALLKTCGQGQDTKRIKAVEEDIQMPTKPVNELTGIKESDTGLAPPAPWDLGAGKQTLQNEQPEQVAHCSKIISISANRESEFFIKYPAAKLLLIIIEKGEGTLENIPQELFMLPLRLTTAEGALKTLKKMIKQKFYKEWSTGKEVTYIEDKLQLLIERLRNTMMDLNICIIEDRQTWEQKFNYDSCPLVKSSLDMYK